MKSIIATACIAFMVTSLMTACSEEKETVQAEPQKKVESTLTPAEKQERLEMEQLEKGILSYRETFKGGDYLISVLTGTYEKTNESSGTIKAQVKVENVHDDGTAVNLSPLKFWIENEKTKQKIVGKALPNNTQLYNSLPQGQSIVFDVSFLIKDVKELDQFYLYIDSKNDPLDNVHWRLDNLGTSQP
ncbi:hypothetical protein NQ129_25655 [Priestia aryabhattai]|uniref:hypothetical protein n=1 Tax=Priestia aryabhattai TaxID=412384 RepID=UPI00211CE1C1|nr:hypothetical protein [Priestia aryabhattai]MCQ9285156.1 hypothetical protein [Priestia aryabhattai]